MIKLLDIQRMSSEDGPGLRTTAFFKGCSLTCAWCHNPESISAHTEILWHQARCMGCLSCVETCPETGLKAQQDGIKRDNGACRGEECLSCVRVCPAGAMEGKGTSLEPEELVHELVKDQAYWGDEGGVTLSGGEALLQEESVEVARLLKSRGVNVALDTCGQVSTSRLRAILDSVDLVLYDLKIADSEQHAQWTGQGNELILKNFEELVRWVEADKQTRTLWVRTPLIPDATDTVQNIERIVQAIQGVPGASDAIARWELCAFNNLCESKYTSAQKEWRFKEVPLVSKEKAEELKHVAEKSKVKDIRITGATS